jgi:predicted transcriptional regulator
MLSVRESTIEMIKNLPSNCTLEDIQYELDVKQKIQNGLEDIKSGNIISEKEMDNEIRSWQE